jgi:DNA polymerase-3 subunit gamma/tau
MYRVLYRKWRPKIFDDVIGQDHIVTTLKNEIESERISHAYLFTGSRGTGKTSCAKIFSKSINCPHSQNGNPCLECSICKGIDSGNILDITEIDAASNNGVENIRSIREEAFFMPSVCKYRVYIVDEVHMLSTGAFNALLKILEEPPQHVIFILATTDIHKVPLTIISRCQRFNFYRILPRYIYDRLNYVCKKENINIESEALNLISNISDGALRDALSILDQFSSQGEEKVTLEKVKNTLGFINNEYTLKLLEHIQNNSQTDSLLLIEDLYIKCINFLKACENIIEYFRNLLWFKIIKDPSKINLQYDLPIKFENSNVNQIIDCIEILKNSYQSMFNNNQPKCEFEICVLKICSVLHEHKKCIPATHAKENKNEVSVKKSQNQQLLPKNLIEFPYWNEILNLLEKNLKSKSMTQAFKNSKAFESGNLLLIKSENSLVFEFLRDNSHRDKIRSLIKQVTGKHYNLGPYKEEACSKTSEKKDLIDSFYEDALKNNINVSM